MAATTLRDRALIRIGGAEARSYMQGLLTQDVLKLAGPEPRFGGLLTAQGKLLFDLVIWAAPDSDTDLLLDCEASRAGQLIAHLTKYRLRKPVTFALEEGLAVHWSRDADAPGHDDPRLAALGRRWLAPATDGDASDAFRAHRLAHGVPEGSSEMGEDKTLWLECNGEELNGVDFRKGCYVGQENTARMHWRNKVNRRLVVLPLAQSDPARQRAAWPELGLALDHRQVESLADVDLPSWQKDAIAPPPAA
jgi:folate-binding protein YgfZ